MSQSKYAQNLQKSDKEKAADVVAHQEAQAKASVASSKAFLQGQLSKEKQKQETLKGSFPLDVQAVVTAGNTIKEIENSLATVQALETELF